MPGSEDWRHYPSQVKAMLHEAIFLATCNATNFLLQVAKKNSGVTPHFATAIIAMRVARKVNDPLLFATLRDTLLACNIPSATCNAIVSEWANQSSSFARRRSEDGVRRLVCNCTRCKF